MACRVGITTDPKRREAEWKSECPSMRNWKIESEHYSKSEAQKEEDRLAKLRGCVSARGGREPENATLWYVYSFTYRPRQANQSSG